MNSVDLGLVLVAVGGWWLIIEALRAGACRNRTRRRQALAGVCRCGHGGPWHQHHHDRTYCAACACTRFQKATTR